jgi:hypothetical protein
MLSRTKTGGQTEIKEKLIKPLPSCMPCAGYRSPIGFGEPDLLNCKMSTNGT